ncbi:MAG: patatin-like phospholipase family protein [Alphaproteobacteria bacterium]|nr:patatin-like phospholipase family protein [Alphaproteobacteria bacterium]
MRLPSVLGRSWKFLDGRLASVFRRRPRAAKRVSLPRRRKARARPAAKVPAARAISLALQGGGSHGAFTWGVLDRLFEDGGFRIDGLSGASAGALNAVVAANGLLDGGPDAARNQLERFWSRVSTKAIFTPYRATLFEKFLNGWNLDGSSRQIGFDLFTRFLSPYQFNPLDLNPLRDLLDDTVDFERLRRNRRLRLFIGATNIATGGARIFTTSEITVDAVLASAALPTLHHAVEIDGARYWDGGFSANPPLVPLIEHCASDDLLLVQIDPVDDDSHPVTADEIRSHVARLTFLGPLMRELETIRSLRKLAQRGDATSLGKRVRSLRLHRIDAGEDLRPLGQTSKLNPEWDLIRHVREVGRRRAESWLETSAEQLGKRATFDLSAATASD